MTTRIEMTGKRSLDFSHWLREKCRDSSTGLIATDIDFFLQDYKMKKLMLLEVKTRNARPRPSQWKQLRVIDAFVRYGAEYYGYDYWGLYVIKLSGTSPENSEVEINGCSVTEEQLISFLNFENKGIANPV